MPAPDDPIAAVSHPEPTLSYAALATAPLSPLPSLGAYVAAGTETVRAVLESPLCGVRPPGEPVPAALATGPAGPLFAQLVRMRDDLAREPLKEALERALAAVDLRRVATVAEAEVEAALGAARPPDARQIDEAVLRAPVATVARLLGVPASDVAQVAGWTRALAAGRAPGATGAQVAAAHESVMPLRVALADALSAATSLLPLRTSLEAAGADDEESLANAIGLLFQTHDATAALVGATLVALAAEEARCARTRDDAAYAQSLVERVVAATPPVHNTRRFVQRDGRIAGVALRAGDPIVVVLAAAVSAHEGCASLAFGAGRHRCPGAALALTLAAACVRALLAAGVVPAHQCSAHSCRPSHNVRLPCFAATNGGTP